MWVKYIFKLSVKDHTAKYVSKWKVYVISTTNIEIIYFEYFNFMAESTLRGPSQGLEIFGSNWVSVLYRYMKEDTTERLLKPSYD